MSWSFGSGNWSCTLELYLDFMDEFQAFGCVPSITGGSPVTGLGLRLSFVGGLGVGSRVSKVAPRSSPSADGEALME